VLVAARSKKVPRSTKVATTSSTRKPTHLANGRCFAPAVHTKTTAAQFPSLLKKKDRWLREGCLTVNARPRHHVPRVIWSPDSIHEGTLLLEQTPYCLLLQCRSVFAYYGDTAACLPLEHACHQTVVIGCEANGGARQSALMKT
jgi:hypothetical protein